MFSLVRFLVVAFVATTSVVADYNTVLNDLKALDQTTKNLTAATYAYTGNGPQLLILSRLSKQLESQIDQATNDTQNSAIPTVSQATTVLNYVNGQLFTDTKSANTATKNKKSTYTANGVLSEVISTQQTIKTKVDALADALIAKSPSSLKSQGQTAKNNYDAVFNNTINYLSNN